MHTNSLKLITHNLFNSEHFRQNWTWTSPRIKLVTRNSEHKTKSESFHLGGRTCEKLNSTLKFSMFSTWRYEDRPHAHYVLAVYLFKYTILYKSMGMGAKSVKTQTWPSRKTPARNDARRKISSHKRKNLIKNNTQRKLAVVNHLGEDEVWETEKKMLSREFS